MPLTPIHPTGGLRIARAVRALLTAFASLLLITCSETPTAPHHGAYGYLSVRPVFGNANALFAPLTIDNIRLTITRPPSTVLKTLTLPFPGNTDTVQVTAAQIPLDAASEDLLVTIDLFAGTTLLFTGQQTVTVTSGAPAQPTAVPVAYQGPGANVATLTLAPRDTTVAPGAILNFLVSAADTQQAPLTSFYVGWKASAGTITNAGQFTAPATRDTVTVLVEAPAPNTTKDSTRVFILPGPGSAAISSGDAQSGLASTRLALPLAVLVKGTDNLPLPGVHVAFAAVTGGGGVDSATTTTDFQGIARTGATLGATVGVQTFSGTVTGIPAVIFTATATAPTGIITWNGTTSNSWTTATNWTPAFVPASTNDVSVPAGTPNQPLLTTTATINNLTIANGATVSLNGGFTFNLTGNVDATGGLLVAGGAPTIQLSGAGKTVQGSLASATVTGTIALAGATTVTGNANVSGGTAVLTIGTGTLTVGGSFSTGSGGRLSMQGTGQLTVAGGVTFAGGDETGQLTAGTLSVAGGFTQSASGSANSFLASGTHKVVLNGTGTQTVNFASAGNVASHFQDLSLQNTAGGVTLANNAYVMGALTAGTGPARAISGAGNTLNLFGTLALSNFTLNNVLLSLTGSTAVTLDTLTFTGYAATATPLTVTHPGSAGGFNFYNLSFSVVPTTGFYLSAIDTNAGDGVPLTLTLINPTPASPGGRTSTAGGAVINWGGIGLRTWNGNTSTDWFTASNWTPAAVPDSTTDVVIPSGRPNAPDVGNNATIHGLTVQAGATVTTVDVGITLKGNLDVQGAITGCCQEPIAMAATGTARGTLNSVTFTVNPGAVVTLNGPLTMTGSSVQVDGELVIGGQTLSNTGSGTLSTGGGTGLLTMTNPADVVTIGAVSFNGGNETGHLTTGVLNTTSFVQANSFTNTTSFVASGTHRVVLTGTTAPVTFASPGLSRFQNLDVTGVTNLSFGSNVALAGQLISTPAGAGPTVTGPANASLTADGANITATGTNASLTMNGVSLVFNGGTIVALNNVHFLNQNPAGTQLSVTGTGAGGPIAFNNLTFGTAPTTGGFYLAANDFDGAANGAFTVNMLGASPTTPGAFVQLNNGAVVNWPAGSGIIWNGSADTNWANPANWNPARVPSSADTVTIAAATLHAANLTANQSVRSLIVNAGAQVIPNGFTLTVGANVTAGTGAFASGGTIVMTGPGTVSGSLPNLTVNGAITASGQVFVTGSLTISGAGANYTAGGQTTLVTGGVITQTGGTLTMTNPADAVVATNGFVFNGGDETGKLTAGVIQSQASFQVPAAAGFVAGGNHTVQMVWSGLGPTPLISFADPATSHFQNLDVTSGLVDSLGTNVTVLGQLSAVPSGTPPVIKTGVGAVLTVGRTLVNGLTLDSLPLVISSGPISSFSKVTFSHQNVGATQLTVHSTGAGGPFTLDALTFLTAPGRSGFYIVANDLDGAGINGALTLNLTAPSPATSNGQVQATNGAVINWPAAAPITWSSTAATTDWNTAANWVGGVVPNAVDSAIIVAGTNTPVLIAPVSVGALNISGGTVNVNGQTLTIARTLATTGSGTLTMTNGQNLDNVQVGGNAIFAGGSTAGKLTAGQLLIAGSFQQLNTNSAASFSADPNHMTTFSAVPGVISFQTPGTGATLSHFGNLATQQFGGKLFIASNTVVTGLLTGGDGFGGTVQGTCGSTFTVPTISGSATFDCVQLVLDDQAGTTIGANGLQFINQPSNVDQLTIQHPGLAASAAYSLNASFTALAGGTGHYINAVDADGSATPNQLVVNASLNPGNGPTFTKTDGIAIVNWAGASGNLWLGGTTDWNTPSNWGLARVPLNTDAVTIPASAPNQPTLTTGGVAGSLQVDAGATLTIDAGNLTMSGGVISNGTILSVNSGGMTLAGQVSSFYSLSGSVGFVSVQSGTWQLTATTTATTLQINSGALCVCGQTLAVSGNMSTSNTGVLQMTFPQDLLVVTGDAAFSGGSETGQLTAGTLIVNGNFTQAASLSGVTTTFDPSGSHNTVLGNTTATTASFGSVGVPGLGSHFQNLDVSKATGGLTFSTASVSTPVFVSGFLSSSNAAGTPTILGGGRTLQIQQAVVTRLNVDRMPVTIVEAGAALPQVFDTVNFQNMDTTSTAPAQLLLQLTGGVAAPQSVIFNKVNFTPLAAASQALYLEVSPSANGGAVNVTITGSAQVSDGLSHSLFPPGDVITWSP